MAGESAASFSFRSPSAARAEINHGRLYPNLDELVEEGLIEKGELDKRTNYYALTERGKQAFADRCEWEQQYTEVAVSSP